MRIFQSGNMKADPDVDEDNIKIDLKSIWCDRDQYLELDNAAMDLRVL
jgi:hypothetical protein